MYPVLVRIFYASFGGYLWCCSRFFKSKSARWAMFELLDNVQPKRWRYVKMLPSRVSASSELQSYYSNVCTQDSFPEIYGYIVFFITDFEYGNDCAKRSGAKTWTKCSMWPGHLSVKLILSVQPVYNWGPINETFYLSIHESTERQERMIWFLECKSVNSQFT